MRLAPVAPLMLAFTAGFEGYGYREVGGSRDYKGLFEITWAEKGDRACWVKVRGRHLNNAATEAWSTYTDIYDPCAKTSSSERTVSFNGQDRYIGGVRVCTVYQALKGIQIYPAKRNPGTGLAGVGTGSDKATQPTCAGGTWSSIYACPSGKVATRLRVHYMPIDPAPTPIYKPKQTVTGLALVCRTLGRK